MSPETDVGREEYQKDTILPHKRVLVIHKELGELIGFYLKNAKINNDVTTSHSEAFRWAEERQYDVAIVHDAMHFTESRVLPALQMELTRRNPHTKMIILSPIPSNVEGLIDEKLFEYPIPKIIDVGSFDAKNMVDMVYSMLSAKKTHKLIEEFLAKIDSQGRLNDDEREFLIKELEKRTGLTRANLETVVKSENGYTSKSGFEFGDIFIKVDVTPRLEHELKVYGLNLGEFNNYRPEIIEFVKSDDISIMALTNLTKKVISCKPSVLFLMGLFHREASKYFNQFNQLIYYGVHGLPHWEESKIPYADVSGDGLKRFEETSIDIKKVKPIVEDYLARQKAEAKTIVHGDWKPENMVNNHLVDYAMIGIGFEVDELAYSLSDYRFQTGLPKFHQIVDRYIQIRCEHDLDFKLKVELSYRQTMHQLADSAFLSQLVLRHSVMNKRDMIDNTKFEQRQYYQHAINQVLSEGRFV